jgi:hypothetical protein
MARVQLLTRSGLDWTGKYPSAIAALANLNVKRRVCLRCFETQFERAWATHYGASGLHPPNP